MPTAKTGAYTVTFTATKGREKQIATITLNVETMPAWSVGTFDGAVGDGNVEGVVTLTVAASGKISGKLLDGGRTWTLSAAAFDGVDGLGRYVVFHATVAGKDGKNTATFKMSLTAEDTVDTTGSSCRRGVAA